MQIPVFKEKKRFHRETFLIMISKKGTTENKEKAAQEIKKLGENHFISWAVSAIDRIDEPVLAIFVHFTQPKDATTKKFAAFGITE